VCVCVRTHTRVCDQVRANHRWNMGVGSVFLFSFEIIGVLKKHTEPPPRFHRGLALTWSHTCVCVCAHTHTSVWSGQSYSSMKYGGWFCVFGLLLKLFVFEKTHRTNPRISSRISSDLITHLCVCVCVCAHTHKCVIRSELILAKIWGLVLCFFVFFWNDRGFEKHPEPTPRLHRWLALTWSHTCVCVCVRTHTQVCDQVRANPRWNLGVGSVFFVFFWNYWGFEKPHRSKPQISSRISSDLITHLCVRVFAHTHTQVCDQVRANPRWNMGVGSVLFVFFWSYWGFEKPHRSNPQISSRMSSDLITLVCVCEHTHTHTHKCVIRSELILDEIWGLVLCCLFSSEIIGALKQHTEPTPRLHRGLALTWSHTCVCVCAHTHTSVWSGQS
jgi:hypothetical protein